MKAIDFIEQEIKLEGDGGYLSKKNLAFLLESFAKRQIDDKEKISLHTEQLLILIDEFLPDIHSIRHNNSYRKLKEYYKI
mgnify:CR=1 FL=1